MEWTRRRPAPFLAFGSALRETRIGLVLAISLTALTTAASAQTIQLVPLLPSAAPGVATAPGTATITGAQGQGKGTVTASLPGSLSVINCPTPLTGKCLGPATVTITHTLSGFGKFLITTTQDGVKLALAGNTKIQQCPVPATTASTFTCDFDYLPYIESGSPYTTRIRFDVLTTNNNFVDANYIVDFQWGSPASPACSVPATSAAGRRAAAGEEACSDKIEISEFRPARTNNPISALADYLPAMCAVGKYSLVENENKNRQAYAIVVLRDEQDRLLAQSKQRRLISAGKDKNWGGSSGNDCGDENKNIYFPNIPIKDLDAQGLWPYARAIGDAPPTKVLTTVRLYAVLMNAANDRPIVQSSPVIYDVVPGVKLNLARIRMTRNGGRTFYATQAPLRGGVGFDYDAVGKRSLRSLLQSTLPIEDQFINKIHLEADLDLAASSGELDVAFYVFSATNQPVKHGLGGGVHPSLSEGNNKVDIALDGWVPLDAARIEIETRALVGESRQRIRFERLVFNVNTLYFSKIVPDNAKCSFLQPGNCLVRGKSPLGTPIQNEVSLTLGAMPKESYEKIQRSVTNTTLTILPWMPPVNQASLFTDTLALGQLDDSTEGIRFDYRMLGCKTNDDPTCANAVTSMNQFLSPEQALGASAGQTVDNLIGGTMSNVSTGIPLVIQTIKSNVIDTGIDAVWKYPGLIDVAKQVKKRLNGKESSPIPLVGKEVQPAYAAATPEYIALPGSWEFKNTLSSGFSALLTLKYADLPLPADPNFSEGKLQILSIDTSGNVRFYPTVLDTAKKEASAQIGSLEAYYGLAIPGPFANAPIMMPSAPSGYSLVNTSSQAAHLQLTRLSPLAEGAPETSTLAALNASRSTTEGWVRAWSDSASVAGASFYENTKVLSVTPASGAFYLFVLPNVEYTARGTTQIYLANPGNISSAVSLTLLKPDGSEHGVFDTTVDAGASQNLRVEQMFPDLAEGFQGYMVISAGHPIVASGMLSTPRWAAGMEAQVVNDTSYAAGPRFAATVTDTNNSVLHLVNLGTGMMTITVKQRNATGGQAAADLHLQLAKGTQISRSLSPLNEGQALASVEVTSDIPGFFGDILVNESSFLPAFGAALPLKRSGDTAAVLPYATSHTSVAVFNPGSSPARVTVTPWSSNGVAGTASTLTVAALARTLFTASAGSFVTVGSDQPVLAAGLVTSGTGATGGYAAIPVPSIGTSSGVTPGPTPAASAAGVLNAASFAGGAISPGEIVTVFGSNIGPAALTTLKLDASGKVATALGEARVLFDDVPGAMIYSLAGQNSVVVPYSVAGKTTTEMVMEYQGRRSDPITLNVAPAAPALFSANSTGTGPGAILNFAAAGSTVNTPQNPVDKGGIIILYGTGEGVVTPPNQDGDVVAAIHTPVLGNAKVTIGGIPANVLFTGSAPSLVAGVLQINVEVPSNVPAGNQPVVVTIGNFSSQAGLTVAIKGTPTQQAPTITVDPTSLDFGTVTVGQTKDLTLTVRNTGAAPLTVTSISGTNSRFSPIGITVPFTVNPGSSQNLTFRFTPAATGLQTGTITIISNDPSRPSVIVPTTGTGGSTLPTITFGQTINGTLTSAAPFASDCDVCFADSYQLTVTAVRSIVITLSSTAFDTYLNVLDSNGAIIGANDDSNGATNSRISGTISPGVYRIEVTTAIAGKTGAYTLAIAQ